MTLAEGLSKYSGEGLEAVLTLFFRDLGRRREPAIGLLDIVGGSKDDQNLGHVIKTLIPQRNLLRMFKPPF